MPFKLVGWLSNYIAEVTVEHALKVALTQVDTEAGFVKLLDGAGLPVLTTENGALSVSQDTILFAEQVDGAAINTNKWITTTSGMTVVQANGYITLNNAAVTTINSYATLTSIKYFPMYSYLPLRVTFNAATPNIPQNLATMEMGIGLVSGTSPPTDGAFFRWTSSAEFRCVINNGGSEVTSAAFAAPAVLEAEIFEIVIVEDLVQFYVGDELVAEVQCPVGNAFPTNNGRLPIFCRVYTAGSAPANPPILYMGQAIVVQEGAIQNRPWSEFLATQGGGSHQSPTVFTQTANHANSTSPTSATLSNTAAGYATLGGRFQFGAVAGAATDFALYAYQVPVGYQLFVRSVSISTLNTGAIGSLTTPTLMDWGVGLNGSAVSLATAEAPPTTWAPRRLPLGMQSWGLSAIIGAGSPDITRTFDPPLIVDSGRYFHVILQIFVGAATASQIFRGDVTISGYFE